MNNLAKIAGGLSRSNGFNFELRTFQLLKSNETLTRNIIFKYKKYNDMNFVSDISVLLVNQLNPFDISNLKTLYNNTNIPNNFKFELPIDDKRAADIIILYKYHNDLNHIGVDTKKSKNNMTQLVRKSYTLLEEYLNETEFNYLYSYLQYENKSRTWVKKNQNDIFKNNICSILDKIKTKWVKERFDTNVLYHNNLLMSPNNNTLNFIDVEKLLSYINKDNCYIKRTNFVFGIKNEDSLHNLVSIKPHGSRKWNDLQLTIYKKAFDFDNICFSLIL
jgi:hypothetical protein